MSARPDDLSCRELVELVTAYLEGSLDAAARARFEAHLGECDGCRTYVEQIRQTVAVTGRLRAGGLAPAARDALLAAFRGWKRGD